MNSTFPLSFAEIRSWAGEAGVPMSEARVRFAQYAILQAISASRRLREGLVFKGGNALDFVWQPNRSTVDLDFSVDHDSILANPDAATIKALLEGGLAVAATKLGLAFRLLRVEPQPPGDGKTFVTFQARIEYAQPDQPRHRQRLEQGEVIRQGIDLDISINEPIGAAPILEVSLDLYLRVATIEDIVAEKLRALLQQLIRNRVRPQDLLDIAVVLREQPELDRILVATFLLIKAEARGVPVSRTAFRHPELADRAGIGYAELAATTRTSFVPFDEALNALYAFIDELPISD